MGAALVERCRATDAPVVVSVNLSPRFMRQDDVVADITRALDETGVDPRCLQIELTERSALTDLEVDVDEAAPAPRARRPRRDRRLRHRLLVAVVPEAAPDRRVEARQVVRSTRSTRVEADVAIVQAVITMGHALGMKVTAEGVERVEQADRLRELGCDTAMGWLWSAAVPPEQLGDCAMAGFPVAGTVRRVRWCRSAPRRPGRPRGFPGEPAKHLMGLEAAAGIEPAYKVLQTSA